MKNTLFKGHGVIVLSVVFGLSFWVVDALIDSIFLTDDTLTESLFHPTGFEVYVRLLAFALIVVFGLLLSRILSKQRRMAEDLEISERKLRTMLDNSNDGIAVYQLSDSGEPGKFIEVTNSLCRLLGYTREELLDLSPVDVTKRVGGVTPLIETAQILRTVGKAIIQRVLLCKNGEEVQVEISSQLFKYQGKDTVIGIIRDVTERLRIEQTMRLQAELLDAGLDSVYLLDEDGNFTYVNKALCVSHGYSREELLKMNIAELDDPESVRLITRRKAEIFKKGRAVFEITHRHKDGSKIPLEVHSSIIEYQGKPLILSISHNIEQRKHLQEQLITQDRLASIGQLVAGVAHELNNPLTSVIGYSELLLGKSLPADFKTDIEIIHSEAQRTAIVVKNLLIFARQEPMEKLAIVIDEPIRRVLQMRGHQQMLTNINVNLNFAANLPAVIGNFSQLQQVFFNLVVNAEQAMQDANKRGSLTITTERGENSVRAIFADDGPGIAHENMGKLFSPFFTTKDVGEGTGLGLSICQGIVTEHGGRIWAESEPGKGATFIVELPVAGEAI